MRRLSLFTAIVALGWVVSFVASTASAQFVAHGISPSVTSLPAQNTGMGFSPGIAPSVTSITPIARRHSGGNLGVAPEPGRRHHRQAFVPIFPGYGFYPYANYDDTATYSQPQTAPPEVQEPEPPAPTIFERRPGYRAPQADSAQSPPASNGQQATSSGGSEEQISAVNPEPSTILVFQDGHQVEIGNYAIVGDTLYNLSAPYVAHKILLAQLDLDATVKANEDRGYEFHLPNQ
jgi:hypothetical protein